MIDSLGDRVVCKMNFPIFEVLRLIDLGAETNVTLIVNPCSERFEISQKNPLSYVELFLTNDQWSLDVFLNYP